MPRQLCHLCSTVAASVVYDDHSVDVEPGPEHHATYGYLLVESWQDGCYSSQMTSSPTVG